MSANLADGHLTYIGSSTRLPGVRLGRTVYDVYPRDGGHQLGWVFRGFHGTWTAMSNDPTVDNAHASTRWEAATDLWGSS